MRQPGGGRGAGPGARTSKQARGALARLGAGWRAGEAGAGRCGRCGRWRFLGARGHAPGSRPPAWVRSGADFGLITTAAAGAAAGRGTSGIAGLLGQRMREQRVAAGGVVDGAGVLAGRRASRSLMGRGAGEAGRSVGQATPRATELERPRVGRGRAERERAVGAVRRRLAALLS